MKLLPIILAAVILGGCYHAHRPMPRDRWLEDRQAAWERLNRFYANGGVMQHSYLRGY